MNPDKTIKSPEGLQTPHTGGPGGSTWSRPSTTDCRSKCPTTSQNPGTRDVPNTWYRWFHHVHNGQIIDIKHIVPFNILLSLSLDTLSFQSLIFNIFSSKCNSVKAADCSSGRSSMPWNMKNQIQPEGHLESDLYHPFLHSLEGSPGFLEFSRIQRLPCPVLMRPQTNIFFFSAFLENHEISL